MILLRFFKIQIMQKVTNRMTLTSWGARTMPLCPYPKSAPNSTKVTAGGAPEGPTMPPSCRRWQLARAAACNCPPTEIKRNDPWISILYTDSFYAFCRLSKKAKIYSVFLYPVYNSIHL